MLHWLVVIPFYFFAALGVFLLLSLATRILRLKVGANALATAAVILAVGVVAVPLSLDWLDAHHFGGRRLLFLGGVTFALAGLDTLLQSLLPSRVDSDLANF